MICLRPIVDVKYPERLVINAFLSSFDFHKLPVYPMVCNHLAPRNRGPKRGLKVRIAVCLKQVPDTETKIKINSDGTGIDTAGIKWIISPYDEHAIEEALKIKQAQGSGEVIAFTLGPKSRAADALRTASCHGL